MLALLSLGSWSEPLPAPFSGRVVAVHDGDTLSVLLDGYAKVIRLDGIDCPEKGQPWGDVATERLASLVLRKNVSVQPKDIDRRYNRLVAKVFIGDDDIGRLLVSEGLAWHFLRYSSDPALARAEVDARGQRRGLWAALDPVAPWDWRHGGASRTSPPQQRLSDPGSAKRTLHGNTNSRVYHEPSCKNYWCARCTRVFASEEDAAQAGFRAAGCCHRGTKGG